MYFNNFSQEAGEGVTTDFALQAPVFRIDQQHQYSPTYHQRLGELSAQVGDYIEASAQAFYPEKEYGIYTMPSLVVEFKRNGQTYKWKGIRITNKVGEAITPYGGTPNVWDTVHFATEIDADAQPEGKSAKHQGIERIQQIGRADETGEAPNNNAVAVNQ